MSRAVLVLAALAAALAAGTPGAARAQSGVPPGVPGDARGFPAIVYRQAYAGREAPASLLAPFGGVHVRGDDPAEWVLARGLDFYVEHSAGRDDLHLDRDRASEAARRRSLRETGDPRFLAREPCLTDPATRERLFATLDRTLAARGGRAGLGYSLGDEVSLTAGGAPEEVCLSPTCRHAWREWLGARGLAERAAELGADDLAAVTTEAALAALDGEARDPAELWLLRREFHHDVVVGLLAELAARVRTARPAAPIGLMGLAGETPFGNVAVERALGFLDFVECYRTFDASELAFTLRGPDQRLYATVFPSAREPAVWAWATSEHFLRGGDGTVIWCDRELERSPPLFESLARATALVRRLRAELGGFRPAPAGVAVLRSSRNSAWCWLEDARDDGATWPKRMASWQQDHGSFELAERAWLELLEDLGLMPGVLPLERVDAGSAARFPLLVASRLACVGEDELARLGRYLAAGGRLVVDPAFARVDAHARPRADGARAAWRAARAGRVLDAPDGIAGYLPLRSAATRASVAGLVALAGVERAPCEPRALGRDVPWLVAWTDGGARGAVCVALPKFPGVGRAAGLGPRAPSPALDDLTVDALARGDALVEWIHPPAGEDGTRRLPAGEPLVVRVRPRAR